MTDFLSIASRRRRWIAGAALAFALLLPGQIQAEGERPDHQLNEKVSEELQKVKPLTDAKNWDGAIKLLNSLKPLAQPNSYDLAVISGIEYKVYLAKAEYAKAIPALELSLRLSDTYSYTDPTEVQEMVYYLAQIYYQEASSTKVVAQQTQFFSKASTYVQRWLKNTDKPVGDQMRLDANILQASIYYNQATLDADNPDKQLLRQAQQVIEDALTTSSHPKENLYLLLLASIQQGGEYTKAAEYLELLVKKFPSKKDYWTQLSNIYLNLASDKDEQKSRLNNIRAILTIERAQEKGFMKTPKDQMNLVSIYFNLGQFGKAADILHSGLKDSSVESTQKNWELLAYAYQQANENFKAIEALKDGAKHFPKSGQLDYQAAQIYYSIDKSSDAFECLKTALGKGNLDKPGAVYSFTAYVCYELRRFEDAMLYVTKAIEMPDGKGDTQLPKLKQAIQDAIKEREATAAAINRT